MQHSTDLNKLLALLLLVAGALFGRALAAPSADLWPHWEQHDAGNNKVIDHSVWTDILEGQIRQGSGGSLNLFDYGGITAADKRGLNAYLERLQSLKITGYNRGEQLAYWLNLYNAATIQLVIEHYPVNSIRNIYGGLFNSGPWDKKLLEVEGRELSLNDVEHRILRPIWKTPLIHYGVNCASIGCPNLPSRAFTGDRAQDRLEANAKAYINSSRGVSLEDGELVVSSIYKWFQTDFGASEAGVIDHLRQHASPELKKALAGRSGIDAYAYDWALNDAR